MSGLDAHQEHVFPSHLGDGIGQFLHPAVVVKTTVVHAVIAMENHFQIVLGRHRHRGNRCVGNRLDCGRERHRSAGGCVSGIRDKSVEQKLLPSLITRSLDSAEGLANNGVRSGGAFTQNAGNHFQFRQATEQRFDQGLNRHQGSIRSAGITPGFEEMRLRQIPAFGRERFVFVITQANHLAHFFNGFFPFQISRSVVGGIATQNHQRLHVAGVHVPDEILNAGCAVLFSGSQIAHRAADVAKRDVHGLYQHMHILRLTFTGQNQRITRTCCLQVLDQFLDPFLVTGNRRVC